MPGMMSETTYPCLLDLMGTCTPTLRPKSRDQDPQAKTTLLV